MNAETGAAGADDATREDELRRLRRRLDRERAARAESERIAEEALRRMYDADELKTVLIGTISHELRSPATVIHGLLDQVLRSWEEYPEEMRRMVVGRAEARAARLVTLIEQVLELAALETATGASQFGEIDMSAWLPVVLDELDVRASHILDVEVEPGCVVRAHDTALRQIVANVVENAQRYSPDGSTLRVRLHRLDGHVELRVADEGPGIPVEDRSRIFEPFYRGRGDHITASSGFGIGLAVVRRLAALFGATVSAHDGPLGGAELCVTLPDEG